MIAENGRVMLTYYKARHPLHTLLLFLALAIGMFYCISSFVNVFIKFEIAEIIIALGFLVIGLYGLIIKPYKEWKNLETHLYTICNLGKNRSFSAAWDRPLSSPVFRILSLQRDTKNYYFIIREEKIMSKVSETDAI